MKKGFRENDILLDIKKRGCEKDVGRNIQTFM